MKPDVVEAHVVVVVVVVGDVVVVSVVVAQVVVEGIVGIATVQQLTVTTIFTYLLTYLLTQIPPDQVRLHITLHSGIRSRWSDEFNALPNCLRDAFVSAATFGRPLKTHLFSAYQHVQRTNH